MCGIAGILNENPDRPVSGELLAAMCRTISHRGPDDEGFFVQGNIGLGMRRLSVIDLHTGKQPQKNEDGTCHIVFNGEIYNYPELRKTCEAKGHHFATHSDTETILHLFEDMGADCVQPLNGMFAFAIHNAQDNSVLLARDRLGIKPLYYASTGNSFVFASEIKALLVHPDISRDIDPIALDQYLTYKYIPAPRTIFKQIRKLPPGHLLTWKDGRFRTAPYWKLSFQPAQHRPEQEISEDLLERLKKSVQLQMISDVPLGALLSGGIDSSLIVALMSQLSDRPVKTFSIGFEERSYNELQHARTIAKKFNTEHHEQIVRPDVADLFERLVTHFDEPFADSSAIPTYLVSRHAREHVTVALSGTGADELFAGYERYWAIPLYRAYGHLPGPLRSALHTTFRHLPAGHKKRGLVTRAQKFLDTASANPIERHQQVLTLFSRTEREALYTGAVPDELDDPLTERFHASDADSDLNRLLDVDTGTLLAEDYLTKDDRMSMAASLELRVPFLDHTLVEFAASLPPGLKLRGLTTKYILKKSASDLLPKNILRRPKHGFEIPVASWLANELRGHVQDLILSPQALSRGLFTSKSLETLVQTHSSGHSNLSRQLWALMALELWFRTSST
ncbi:MAG: asparagine synthase (glutamine-hydrolyzing) [bacterium]|nr:asparagine synthase (glutamine-hydrolyzing) [bacterium]